MDSVTAEASRSSVSELWNAFSSARSEEDYFQGWLALQSGLIPGVVQSLLIMATPRNTFSPVAGWPEGKNDPLQLSDVVERVLEERCGLLVELPASSHYGIAYPLLIDEELRGVVALEISVTAEQVLQKAMEQLQWGIVWLEVLVRRKQAEEDRTTLIRLKTAVDLLAETLGKEHFSEAGIAFTTKLADATGCERVSLGFMRGKHIKLESVSHSSEVGKKMNLTRSIEAVMEEAILQRREVAYPPLDNEILICREHEALSRQQSMASIASFPLFSHDLYYGVLTCERAANQPFSQHDVEFMRAVAALSGPALENKFANDRPLGIKIQLALQKQWIRLAGPGYVKRKLALAAMVALMIFFSFATGEYRLSADTTLEGAIHRAIVVPFDGYIDHAPSQAGDRVEEGQLLCSLDNRDLGLKKLSKLSEYRQLEQQYQDASANHDRAKSGIIKAQLDQARAELDLIEANLTRTQMTAPFRGLLVSGDLSQRLGGAVKQGEVLFEVTPLDAYRVILKVDERRIADVRATQKGTLVLSSLPDRKYPFVINRITPIARAEEGRNYFRVEAHLERLDDSLRPGMEGVGKIHIDRRKWIGIWTRDLREWMTLTLWSWMP